MKRKYIWIFTFMVISCLICSCEKFVQIGPPTSTIVTASVFNSNAAATSAQLAIYSQMVANNESANMSLDLGLLSDGLINYNLGSTSLLQYYTNSMNAVSAPGPWKNAYNYIYEANAVIEGVSGNSALANGVRQQLFGEAEFIRAFWFFYLTNLYGDVPLVTTTNYKVNSLLSRTSRSQVYQQMIQDLKDAESKLNSQYVDASDTTVVGNDRSRPTKWAAAALLARVYLYTDSNANAEAESDSVIRQASLYGLYNNLDSVFLVNSEEAIWQLGIPLPTNYNTYDGRQYILTSAPGGSTNCCSMDTILVKSFEPNDNRLIHWVGVYTTNTIPIHKYYYPWKYKVASGSTVKEDVMVLRLAEQFLIRAEARAKQGNVAGAISDLNIIRGRAGLASYAGNTDEQSVLNAILHERQIELFSEWGHRWLDLARTGSIDSVMGVVAPLKGGAWDNSGYQSLFPIPQSDRNVDQNLTQNPGY